MGSVSFAVAYVGGILTLFSPCSALLVPSFFAYAFSSSRHRLLSRTLIFFLGLLAALLPLGVTLGALGGVLLAQLRGLTMWGGLLIAFFGLWQVLALPLPKLPSRPARTGSDVANANSTSPRRDKTSVPAIFLLGLTYGLASTGCSGPILGAIGAFAVTGGSALTGFFIMLFYALGMFTPVAVLAFAWGRIPHRWVTPKPVTLFGRPTTRGNIISGTVLLVLGLIMAVFGGGRLSGSLLSVSRQTALENSARLALSAVPDWLFLTFFALLATFIAVYLWGRRK